MRSLGENNPRRNQAQALPFIPYDRYLLDVAVASTGVLYSAAGGSVVSLSGGDPLAERPTPAADETPVDNTSGVRASRDWR